SILIKGGKDATEAFDAIHSSAARVLADKYCIGKVLNVPVEETVEQEEKGEETGKPHRVDSSVSVSGMVGGGNNNNNGVNGGSAPTGGVPTSGTDPNELMTANEAVLGNPEPEGEKLTVVVVGLGMVGLRFIEKLIEYDTEKKYRVVVFGEEKHLAYNRGKVKHTFPFHLFQLYSPITYTHTPVGLTQYFTHRSLPTMLMTDSTWYTTSNLTLHLNDPITSISTSTRTVTSSLGITVPYDRLVLATGSSPFVPPLKGGSLPGVYVYRTIEDLELIIERAKGRKTAVVVGGGLLGLEAAKACHDLGLRTTILERAPWLMRRQMDEQGGKMLATEIGKLGLTAYVNTVTQEVVGGPERGVEGVRIQEEGGEVKQVEADMVVLSCGIIPRDDVAKQAGIKVGPRGGIMVDDHLVTSDENVMAIGECVLHGGMVYGLVAPGYDMADTAAAVLCGMEDKRFTGADMSTKLKLLGVNVASFGDYFADPKDSAMVTFHDPFASIYKCLIFNKDASRLLGGILVGDTNDYGKLLALTKSTKPLTQTPADLLHGSSAKKSTTSSSEDDDLPDDAQICSCNNVTKSTITTAITKKGPTCSITDIKKCTKAGTSCGGCVPVIQDVLTKHLAKTGAKITTTLCEHFAYSRAELFDIIKVTRTTTFSSLLASHGTSPNGGGGEGCEICKPTIASILASLYNEHVLDPPHKTLQDTNDRFLANMQRDGSFSVVPRMAGGVVTPEGLIAIGEIAKRFGLYTKVTGGQRIDMFGARKQDLPEIWSLLVTAGFESGHAYGKSLRTIKSCVGSEWCRYGMRDSVTFAVFLENRYKGLRSPHKLKSAVSGCIRECAEAQGKDFGLIATDKGYNLYVCGNGGSKPKHAVLLAAEIPEETCVKYIDRFLMFYVATADRLMRTARWLEKLPGGIEYLKQVVVEDKLGICDELESRMEHIVATYQDEWKTVVEDPIRRADFVQFVNTPTTEPTIEMVTDKHGQRRPADQPKNSRPRRSRKLISLDSDTTT
ncbi:hypothetical protein HK104_005541, partial [Borealophlyctis nickersoniae]